MNMSEILTRVDSLNDRSHLVARSVEREETPVLSLVDTERTSEMPDPLIQALVDKLPKPNTIWPGSRLRRWHSISFTRPASAWNSSLRPN